MEKSNYNRGGGRGRCCGSGSGRGGNKQYHQGHYQSDGYGRRGGRGGDRSGTQMGTNPPPAQPWGYRSVQGGRGGIQRPQSAMGQGAGTTGGRRSWSGSPRHEAVAGRGSWASAEGGGARAGQTRRRILYLFLFIFMFLNQGRDVRHNISPGTVLDTKIVHKNLGTSKPTHYYVLYDVHNFTSDQLQKFMYQLCFTFARCTKPISLVPPVYYAALVAYRGRMEMQFTPSASSSTSFTSSSSSSSAASFEDKFYKLHSELQNIMSFI